jgi:hypothetical protein
MIASTVSGSLRNVWSWEYTARFIGGVINITIE